MFGIIIERDGTIIKQGLYTDIILVCKIKELNVERVIYEIRNESSFYSFFPLVKYQIKQIGLELEKMLNEQRISYNKKNNRNYYIKVIEDGKENKLELDVDIILLFGLKESANKEFYEPITYRLCEDKYDNLAYIDMTTRNIYVDLVKRLKEAMSVVENYKVGDIRSVNEILEDIDNE